ncbi:hypothetical protein [Vibrio atlanticus]|nr:hypothetical protein [Vibrio atlanticus]
MAEVISKAFKQAARELEVSIIWAGDRKSLRDGPHVESFGVMRS